MYPSDVDRALSLPADEAARALLSLPESQWFERKSGSVAPKDLAQPLVAMANAEGGVVVAGLLDGRVSPVADEANNSLRQAAIDFTRPSVRVRVVEIETSSGRILVFHVSPGGQVHETNKGECYLRIGDESRRLSFAQRQDLQWDRGAASFDGTSVNAGVSDLDESQLSAYQDCLGASSITGTLRARDLLTREGAVTVAGYLLFAERPQAEFPSAHVRVLKYRDEERGSGRNQTLISGADVRCEGSIPNQIHHATQVVEELLPRRRALSEDGRFMDTPIIPRDAWLEGVVNAVVHRSYSIGGDHVRVEIFPNRIEITSPGRFPGMAQLTQPENIGRNARNPRIARVAADMGITQELGEGIRRIFAEMRRVGLSDPMYAQAPEAVRLTLLASDTVPAEVISALGSGGQRVLDGMRRAQRPLGTGQIAELVDLTRPTVLRHLNKLREAGIVTWQGESAKDPRATWRLS